MFLEENIIEFINKIIYESKEQRITDVKNNIEQFKNYLELTKMGSQKSIEWIGSVADCLPELIALSKKINDIDVSLIIPFEGQTAIKNKTKLKTKTIQDDYDKKHYSHYNSYSSSNCGSSSSTNSRC